MSSLRHTPSALLALAVVFSAPLTANDGRIPAAELSARRAAIMRAIGDDGIAVLLSAPTVLRNGDASWPFRQDDNLYYLTAVGEPETALALVPGESQHREVLFARDRDPADEIWNGLIPEHDALASRTGIDEVVSAQRLDEFLQAALGGTWWGETTLYRYYRPPALPSLKGAMDAGRATLWLDLGDRGTSPAAALAERLRRRYPELRFRDLRPLLEAQREIKSGAELELLQEAVDITVAAHQAAMRRALTATAEHQIEATLEFELRDRGACCPGYESIVGAGEHATILHYIDNDAPVARGDLVLIDAGAEYRYYTADVTRTFPADGTFSAPQKEIYEAVLRAWTEGLALMRVGGSLREVHLRTLEIFGEELLELGLVSRNEQAQVELYFMHGVGHPIGLAVHDVFDRTRPFEADMVVTLEPGLYVRPADVEASATFTALPEAERRTIRSALERYAGIGVRIEDDVRITAGDPVVLSDGLPRTIESIEAFMAAALP